MLTIVKRVLGIKSGYNDNEIVMDVQNINNVKGGISIICQYPRDISTQIYTDIHRDTERRI